MPRKSHRGASSSGGGASLPIAHSPAQKHVELNDAHTIDMEPTKRGSKSKSSGGGKKSTGKKQTKESSDDDQSDDDPYETPPPSTAGDEFYNSFAALELKITQGSAQLAAIIRILKQIRLHPDVADRLADELDDKLSDAGALLTEIGLIQKKFIGFNTQGNAHGKFSTEEKAKRASLRDRVNQDIVQLTNSYRTLRAASQPHIPSHDAVGDDLEDPSHHSLLSDSVPTSPAGAGSSYQTEYIGELDGHLAMLAEQAEERNRFMKTIESDVVQVHDLFRDVNAMVNAQQTMVDDIDAKISDTQENARQGMEQLIQAQQYQAAKRKKMCFLVLILIVALFLFFLFLWIAFGS